MKRTHSTAAAGVMLLAAIACKQNQQRTALKDDAAATQGTATHMFKVQTKGFIAPVSAIGTLPGVTGRNLRLKAFAKVTNLNFSENPPDGEKGSEQYRLWAQMELEAVCTNGTLSSFKIASKDTDAGFEPSSKRLRRIAMRAETDSLVAKADKNGHFYYQASGRPPLVAEPAFQSVARRASNTIWYTVEGQVSCKPNNDADINIPRDSVHVTSFPTTRLWVTKTSQNFEGYPAKLVHEFAQGDFADLWRLPEIPGSVPQWGLRLSDDGDAGLPEDAPTPSHRAADGDPKNAAETSEAGTPEQICGTFYPDSFKKLLADNGFNEADLDMWDVPAFNADRDECIADLKAEMPAAATP